MKLLLCSVEFDLLGQRKLACNNNKGVMFYFNLIRCKLFDISCVFAIYCSFIRQKICDSCL